MSEGRTYLGLLIAVLAAGLISTALAQNQETDSVDRTGSTQALATVPRFGTEFPAVLVGQDDESTQPIGASPFFGGGEYRYIRPSFSEAIAFATVTDSITAQGFSRQVRGQELSFDYDSSMRFYMGCHLGDFQDIRFSYWYLDTEVFVNGTAGAGQTLVDPFGNLALTGSRINTQASVKMNVFDLEYIQTMNFPFQNVDFTYSAGLRFADVDQYYDALIRNAGGTLLSSGVFNAAFDGIGPYLTLAGNSARGDRPFSLLAKGGAALLIGSYDVSSRLTIPGVAIGGQTAERIRAVPVLEAELGASWHPNQSVTVSAGWLVQAWFNIGTSGGTFDGEALPVAPIDTVFGQTDDADIMSFDGLFLRAEVWF